MEHMIYRCERDFSSLNLFFVDVQKLPGRIFTLVDKFIQLNEVVEYEVKRDKLHYDIKCLITMFMEKMKEEMKFLKVIIMDMIDSQNKEFIPAYDLEDTFLVVNDRQTLGPYDPRDLNTNKDAYTFEPDQEINVIIAENGAVVDPWKQTCVVHHLRK